MALVILIMGTSACGKQQTRPQTPQLKFVVIVNGSANQSFWSQVKQGINKAAKVSGVKATYQTLETFNGAALSHLIDVAVAAKPDGLVLSVPDCTALTPALRRAQLVGIPIISLLSGSDCVSKLGLLTYINPTEYQLGLESGQKLVAAGARHVLCVNQDTNNPDFSERCHGISDAFVGTGRKSEVLAVDSDTVLTVQEISDKLAHNASIDAVITLDPTVAPSALAAVQQSGHMINVKLVTFGMSSEVSQEIQNGILLFSVDQKPYERGYQSIVLLSQYKKHQSPVTTPPIDYQFVTIDNIQQVQQN